MRPKVLLITPTSYYQVGPYLAAAKTLQIDLHLACNQTLALEVLNPGQSIRIDFTDTGSAVDSILEYALNTPFDAVLGVDEFSCTIAAQAAEQLKLNHNPPAAVATAHNKFMFRRHLAATDLPCPGFRLISPADNLHSLCALIDYPCVLKPLQLSASRGILRANDVCAAITATERIRALLKQMPAHPQEILVEDFIPGPEFALEGLIENGCLHRLALFDKPDPLDGPVFEESIYVTPSRLPTVQQDLLFQTTSAICTSLGLHKGPVHAELRLNDGGAWLIELATRSIGGRCSNTLNFGNGIALEELVLRNALDMPATHLLPQPGASAVMMIPIPARGRLLSVLGLEQARKIPGITALSIDIAIGAPLVPLPEGDRYLGFIFARGQTPEHATQSLRQAHSLLKFNIAAF